MGTPEELHQLAVALDEFAEGYDTYEYQDNIEDKEEHLLSLERSLTEQDTDSIRGYLLDFANGDRSAEGFAEAEMLLKQMDALIPQKPGTVLNLYGSMGSDYNMIRITNMEPEQVKAVLEEMIATIPEEQIDNVEAYLEQAGASIEQIGGSYNDFSPHFPVMLEYDFDANQVYVPAAEPELGTFTIYQLKSGEELHYHRFEPLERLERFGLFVDPDNYEKVYTGDVPEDGSIMMKLENIYKTFNLTRRISRDTAFPCRMLWCFIRTGKIPPSMWIPSALRKCLPFSNRSRTGSVITLQRLPPSMAPIRMWMKQS